MALGSIGKVGAKLWNAFGKASKAVKAIRPTKILKPVRSYKANRAADKLAKARATGRSPGQATPGKIVREAYHAAGGKEVRDLKSAYDATTGLLPDGYGSTVPRQYTDGTWETEEEAKLRAGKEKTQLEQGQERARIRKESEKRQLEVEQEAGWRREDRRIWDATPAERTRMDVERDLMDPDYEINHRRELGLSEGAASSLVGAREARLNAMAKGGRAPGPRGRRRKKMTAATAATAATVGIILTAGALLLGQCTLKADPSTVETSAAAPQDPRAAQPTDPNAAAPAAPVAPVDPNFDDYEGDPVEVDEPADPEDTGGLDTPEGGTDVDTSTTSPDDPTTTEPATPTSEAVATTSPTAAPTVAPTAVPTAVPTATAIPTAVPTAVPAPVPYAHTQNQSLHCTNPDIQVDYITVSYKIRDTVTFEDLIAQYEGVGATLQLSSPSGTYSANATISNAFVQFQVPISPPEANFGTSWSRSLTIGGVAPAYLSGSDPIFSQSFCNYG